MTGAAWGLPSIRRHFSPISCPLARCCLEKNSLNLVWHKRRVAILRRHRARPMVTTKGRLFPPGPWIAEPAQATDKRQLVLDLDITHQRCLRTAALIGKRARRMFYSKAMWKGADYAACAHLSASHFGGVKTWAKWTGPCFCGRLGASVLALGPRVARQPIHRTWHPASRAWLHSGSQSHHQDGD
jgi:hypothetical protein